MMLHRRRHWNTRKGAGSRSVLIILAIVAALLVVGCLACAGLTYFGFTGMVDEAIKEQYNDHPVIEQHIGEIESATLDLTASQAAKQEFGSDEYIVIGVSGSKGEGQLILERPEGESFHSSNAVLRTSEGDFDLDPSGFPMNVDRIDPDTDAILERRPPHMPEMGAPGGNPTGANASDAESGSGVGSDSRARFPTPPEPENETAPPPAFPRPTD